ncbi:helicase [Sedimentibacter hydroxybenzoicus DSM 7310]|uniref:Helicase n=1 Tax=Sedimentibacter hydroxybenzoicus DSM 7310 TaxID=1123245 RepID=A0A974BIN3_SEDHY|nr:DEAD/DEAH box helicase [Sedimentibacter hydroxybenzoicus]NYB73878.1 helicase [Sedimentibacter hydroxybenzoicus DSM 7310]
MTYEEFLKSKQITINPSGFDCESNNKYLFDFQRDITGWALKKGKSAMFLDTGLGKTITQLSWADEICKYTGGKILILAPLAVSKQTVREGQKFGIKVNACRSQIDAKDGINITNYEMLHRFDINDFVGVVLDESSIIKSFSGKTTQQMLDLFIYTPYKLACTATPAPNDYEELGNHAEFLGVMSRSEMLATFFVHDSGDTAKWRLKGHAETEFWKWIASWAMVVKNPEDLGYDGSKYKLPKLNIQTHFVESPVNENMFIVLPAQTLDERRQARKESLKERVNKTVELVQGTDNCLVWCDYNDESTALTKAIPGAVEVKGSDTPEHKENALIGFATNDVKYLVTKPKIAGFGMNWQNCNDVIFCGLSDSYERFYQAIRRCYRFGQTKEVNVHVVISEKEESVLENIKRKEEQAQKMSRNMVDLTSEILKNEIRNTTRNVIDYNPKQKLEIPSWLKEVI